MATVESAIEPLDFSDLEAKYAVEGAVPMDRFVVIDGLPVAPDSKVELLTKVIKTKVLAKTAPLAAHGRAFYMPVENGKSQGFAFVEFADSDGAAAAVALLNNKKFDNNHVMRLDRLSSIQKARDAATEFVEPVSEKFKPLPHLRSWLTDSLGRDQALLHVGDTVEVDWFRKDSAPQPALRQERFTEAYVKWSPKGTYLLSIHRQGVQLHGGPKFEVVARFPHREARLVDFSPTEEYLVTGSPVSIPAPPEDPHQRANWKFKDTDEGNNIVIWSVRTATPLRTFPLPPPPPPPPGSGETPPGAPRPPPQWPAFKWSADGRYFARVAQPDTLSIYDTNTAMLVGKQGVRAPGIVDFTFAPATIGGKQLLAYWTPEAPNQTARVCILDAATKLVVRNRSLFNVVRCSFHWQTEALYLCVRLDRLTKNKKHIFSSLEIFRMNERDMPVEVVDLAQVALDFQWEPKGSRFALVSYFEAAQAPQPPLPITAPPALPNTARNIVSVYALEHNKGLEGTWKEANRLPDRGTTSLHWSPRGRFLVSAQFKASKPLLEFWDVDYEGQVAASSNGANPAISDLPINLCFLTAAEHFGITGVEWDPSGRYVVSMSTLQPPRAGQPIAAAGAQGYKLWDCTGLLLREQSLDQFKAFFWRPRPPSLLSKEQRKQINKTVKQLAAEFDLEDETLSSAENVEEQQKRDRIMSEWESFRAQAKVALSALGQVPEEDRFVVKNGQVFVVESEVVEEEEEEEVE